MKVTVPTTMRELNSRVNDGIHVRLLWAERDCRLAVTVSDIRTAEAFCIEIRDDEDALEVFHHPYAYAAWHGIDTGVIFASDEPDISVAA